MLRPLSRHIDRETLAHNSSPGTSVLFGFFSESSNIFRKLRYKKQEKNSEEPRIFFLFFTCLPVYAVIFLQPVPRCTALYVEKQPDISILNIFLIPLLSMTTFISLRDRCFMWAGNR